MGTKISTTYEKAGVECPKETGKMDMTKSCRECEHYSKCLNAVFGTLYEK